MLQIRQTLLQKEVQRQRPILKSCPVTFILLVTLTHIYTATSDDSIRVSKLAQWVKTSAVNPDKLGLIPRPTEWKIKTTSAELISDLSHSSPIPQTHTGTRAYRKEEA